MTSKPVSAADRLARAWVSFVGSGPGDPELLTVRAVDVIKQADVVVTETPGHADLVRSLLGLPTPAEPAGEPDQDAAATAGPEIVDGGFGEDGQPLTHASRAKLVVKHAKRGLHVVRLLAGDPFLYASGPEEAQAVAKAGIGFEIVPGVSSVAAVPAYAGIPLTTREHREVTVLTCPERLDKIAWGDYAEYRNLVLLSSVNRIDEIAERLVAAARPADTPVAMTRVGTTTAQETVTATGVSGERPAATSAFAVSAIVPTAESSTRVGVSRWWAQSTFSPHVTTATSRWSLVVSGMPAYAGTALTEEMPGTISKPRPAFTQACASSGPEA